MNVTNIAISRLRNDLEIKLHDAARNRGESEMIRNANASKAKYVWPESYAGLTPSLATDNNRS